MAASRYVVLGLALPSTKWFGEVAHWATTGAAPIEFVKCVSIPELRARLAANRPFSALLLDAGVPGIDRDLIDEAADRRIAILVVRSGNLERDWVSLGVDSVLPESFGRDDLVAALDVAARLIGRAEARTDGFAPSSAPRPWRGRLVAVTGPGGTGSSTLAMGLAQGVADDIRYRDSVLLADFGLDADLAMLHDTGDVVPGVQELVEAHRAGRLAPDGVREMVYDIVERRYHLLLGLRRHRDWVVLRPRAVESALDSLAASYRMVIADIDADFEGEDDCGSLDVEDRNSLARTTVRCADAVVAVGQPGAKGTFALARVIGDLARRGVAAERILPVFNRTAARPRARAEIGAALNALVRTSTQQSLPSPLFIGDRRKLEDSVRDAARLPSMLTTPLARAVHAVLARLPRDDIANSGSEPVRITPGSIGAWSEEAG